MAHARASIGAANDATTITAGRHRLAADEGPELGGKDAGPPPYDLLTSALGACHADIRFVREGETAHIDRVLTNEGPLDEAQRKRMADIAGRTPVTLTLKGGFEIRTWLA